MPVSCFSGVMTESNFGNSEAAESESSFGDEVYADGVEDVDDIDPSDTLLEDNLADDPLDEGYTVPEREPHASRFGTTAFEESQGESLDQLLAEEEPDVSDDGSDEDEDARSGRLVAEDEGAHPSYERDSVANDVGLAGKAASAEEAAVHIIEE
jgi:Family of unknown function (DUF5709)